MPLPLVHCLYPSRLSKYLHEYANGEASWALVTGASDGIGKALCSELSARGFNIVLHGRNEAKLARVREELEAAQPQRHFRTVTADATSFSQTDIDRIVAQVSDIPLSVLINNVGGTAPLSSNFKHFESTTPTEMHALFSLNVYFPMQLTRAILPYLAQQSKPTTVITCGSQANVGQPYVAVYSGCKGALHAWSRALAAEQYEAKSHVDILEVVVGGTYTQKLKEDPNMSANLFMPTAEVMARAVLARVGHGHRSVVPYFWHLVQSGILSLLPQSMADSIVASILKPSVEPKDKRNA
jgi:17beta-estradiol 17-dehydrogenase / very-long-chain 3-oxoacyl-CoA reductase